MGDIRSKFTIKKSGQSLHVVMVTLSFILLAFLELTFIFLKKESFSTQITKAMMGINIRQTRITI